MKLLLYLLLTFCTNVSSRLSLKSGQHHSHQHIHMVVMIGTQVRIDTLNISMACLEEDNNFHEPEQPLKPQYTVTPIKDGYYSIERDLPTEKSCTFFNITLSNADGEVMVEKNKVCERGKIPMTIVNSTHSGCYYCEDGHEQVLNTCVSRGTTDSFHYHKGLKTCNDGYWYGKKHIFDGEPFRHSGVHRARTMVPNIWNDYDKYDKVRLYDTEDNWLGMVGKQVESYWEWDNVTFLPNHLGIDFGEQNLRYNTIDSLPWSGSGIEITGVYGGIASRVEEGCFKCYEGTTKVNDTQFGGQGVSRTPCLQCSNFQLDESTTTVVRSKTDHGDNNLGQTVLRTDQMWIQPYTVEPWANRHNHDLFDYRIDDPLDLDWGIGFRYKAISKTTCDYDSTSTALKCGPGYEIRNYECVECPDGSVYNNSLDPGHPEELDLGRAVSREDVPRCTFAPCTDDEYALDGNCVKCPNGTQRAAHWGPMNGRDNSHHNSSTYQFNEACTCQEGHELTIVTDPNDNTSHMSLYGPGWWDSGTLSLVRTVFPGGTMKWGEGRTRTFDLTGKYAVCRACGVGKSTHAGAEPGKLSELFTYLHISWWENVFHDDDEVNMLWNSYHASSCTVVPTTTHCSPYQYVKQDETGQYACYDCPAAAYKPMNAQPIALSDGPTTCISTIWDERYRDYSSTEPGFCWGNFSPEQNSCVNEPSIWIGEGSLIPMVFLDVAHSSIWRVYDYASTILVTNLELKSEIEEVIFADRYLIHDTHTNKIVLQGCVSETKTTEYFDKVLASFTSLWPAYTDAYAGSLGMFYNHIQALSEQQYSESKFVCHPTPPPDDNTGRPYCTSLCTSGITCRNFMCTWGCNINYKLENNKCVPCPLGTVSDGRDATTCQIQQTAEDCALHTQYFAVDRCLNCDLGYHNPALVQGVGQTCVDSTCDNTDNIKIGPHNCGCESTHGFNTDVQSDPTMYPPCQQCPVGKSSSLSSAYLCVCDNAADCAAKSGNHNTTNCRCSRPFGAIVQDDGDFVCIGTEYMLTDPNTLTKICGQCTDAGRCTCGNGQKWDTNTATCIDCVDGDICHCPWDQRFIFAAAGCQSVSDPYGCGTPKCTYELYTKLGCSGIHGDKEACEQLRQNYAADTVVDGQTCSIKSKTCPIRNTEPIDSDCNCDLNVVVDECAAGKYCIDNNVCSDVPVVEACPTTDDVARLTSACKCDPTSTSNECTKNQFCRLDNSCTNFGNCVPNNFEAVNEACKCSPTSLVADCAAGKYCYSDNRCRPIPLVSCPTSMTTALANDCSCDQNVVYLSNECAAGKYCYPDQTCQDPVVQCPAMTIEGNVFLNSDCKCATNSAVNDCAAGKYCTWDRTTEYKIVLIDENSKHCTGRVWADTMQNNVNNPNYDTTWNTPEKCMERCRTEYTGAKYAWHTVYRGGNVCGCSSTNCNSFESYGSVKLYERKAEVTYTKACKCRTKQYSLPYYTSECAAGNYCAANSDCATCGCIGGTPVVECATDDFARLTSACKCATTSQSNECTKTQICDSSHTCRNFGECVLDNHSPISNADGCRCDPTSNFNECATGQYCYTDQTCHEIPIVNCQTSNTDALTIACRCATTSLSHECAAGKYCNTDMTCRDTLTLDCQPSNTDVLTSDCNCDPTPNSFSVCLENKYCWTDKTCRDFPDCQTSNTDALLSACRCGTASIFECAVGKYCYTDKICRDFPPSADCPTSNTDALTSACKCAQTSNINECAVGKYCWTDKFCRDSGLIDCDVSNDIKLTSDCKCNKDSTVNDCKQGAYCYEKNTYPNGRNAMNVWVRTCWP